MAKVNLQRYPCKLKQIKHQGGYRRLSRKVFNSVNLSIYGVTCLIKEVSGRKLSADNLGVVWSMQLDFLNTQFSDIKNRIFTTFVES